MDSPRASWLAVGIVVLACALEVASIGNGHDWGDDFAQYITHAQNLASGRPYAETRWIYAPDYVLGPRTYPPGFPLLLAPVYRIFGLNFVALKLVGIASLAIALLALSRLIGRGLHPLLLGMWIALAASQPLLVSMTGQVLSDLPFLMWAALALLSMDRSAAAEEGGRAASATRWALGAGAAIGAAAATRTVGLVLLPVFVVVEAIRFRRVRRAAMATLLIAVCGVAIGLGVARHQADYLNEYAFAPPSRLLRYSEWYASDLVSFLPGFSRLGDRILALARVALGLTPQNDRVIPASWPEGAIAAGLVALAAAGFVAQARRRVGPAEVFFIAYPCAVIAGPSYIGGRGLLPLAPLTLFYLLAASSRFGKAAVCSLTAAAIVLNLAAIPGSWPKPGIDTPDARRFLDAMRNPALVPADAIVVFDKPRALALLTGRAGVAIPPGDDASLFEHVARYRATHVAAGVDDDAYLRQFAERHRARFALIFRSGAFVIYRALP